MRSLAALAVALLGLGWTLAEMQDISLPGEEAFSGIDDPSAGLGNRISAVSNAYAAEPTQAQAKQATQGTLFVQQASFKMAPEVDCKKAREANAMLCSAYGTESTVCEGARDHFQIECNAADDEGSDEES